MSCAAGFRLKSVDGREQVSLSAMLSSRPGLPGPGESVRRSLGQLVRSPPEAGVLAAHLSPITKKRGICYLFSPPSGKKAEIFFSAALMDLDALAFEMPSALAMVVTFIFRA